MFYPSLKDFLTLSKKGNVIPVYKEINADLDTAVSCFLKMRKTDYSFLLESVEGQEKVARYSFMGTNPALIFRSKGKRIDIMLPHKKRHNSYMAKGSPLKELKSIMRDFKPVSIKGLPRFYGGLVGYIGYDMVRFFEDIPDKNKNDLDFFDSVFLLTDTMLIFDHVNHTIKIVKNIILKDKLGVKTKKHLYGLAAREIEAICAGLDRVSPALGRHNKNKKSKLNISSNLTKGQFCGMVKKAKLYIKKGDIIQVVLSQRLKTRLTAQPFNVYRNLRSLNPSPYMFFLQLKDTVLVGSSPEMLVRCEEGMVRTRPIAGTRPRGQNEKEDQRLEKELMNDKKEKAEHIMLVDLGRNDLGRVCKSGQVRVTEFMKVEKYSHVMHLVSEVEGALGAKYDAYDVMQACFPAGTVSGSPKIRAMEIIDELENVRRGPYAGSVGYFSFSHNMDTCITIRTIAIKGKNAYIQAGAGIVADSVPEREYAESMNKAKALVEALLISS